MWMTEEMKKSICYTAFTFTCVLKKKKKEKELKGNETKRKWWKWKKNGKSVTLRSIVTTWNVTGKCKSNMYEWRSKMKFRRLFFLAAVSNNLPKSSFPWWKIMEGTGREERGRKYRQNRKRGQSDREIRTRTSNTKTNVNSDERTMSRKEKRGGWAPRNEVLL